MIDGLRSAEVFEKEIKGFNGAFQCDYYSGYRHIGTGNLKGMKRIPCLQHIKRKFLDIKDDNTAQQMTKCFGLLYHLEHKHKTGCSFFCTYLCGMSKKVYLCRWNLLEELWIMI